MRGATRQWRVLRDPSGISIHTPHAGSDCIDQSYRGLGQPISIHTPHAGSDGRRRRGGGKLQYFNPHSPCGERLRLLYFPTPPTLISIHTPHAGSDRNQGYSPAFFPISIHTPHAGSDGCKAPCCHCICRFQSTLPMRGATTAIGSLQFLLIFQSTLPMRGATLLPVLLFLPLPISIHTPHAGSDPCKAPL